MADPVVLMLVVSRDTLASTLIAALTRARFGVRCLH